MALTPGGLQEALYVNSCNLVLNRRKGFVRLAAECNAALVPVLCLGEQNVVSAACLGFRVFKFLVAWRPVAQRVVFGSPIVRQENESVDDLHARYVAALLAVGKEHGVSLNVVE